jgi:proteasome lid subunit RPN8/RPN11
MTAAHPDVAAQGRANAPFKMPRRRWRRLLAELHRRGQGRRESGAFLLAGRDHDPDRVTRVAYYDDLDADCLTGGISFATSGFTELWRICENENLRVVADVHTHPSSWVEQSGIDAENPMIARVGHVAMIVPSFGHARQVEECGVHIYLGSRQWLPVPADEAGAVVGVYGLFTREQAEEWFAGLKRLLALGGAA